MDPTPDPGPADPPAVSVGQKRPIQNGSEGQLGTQMNKRPRVGSNSEKDLRRVAEIVLALSTMAKIRGGRKPTEPEIGLMGEARSKLVELCEGLAPKDIVPTEAVGAVIEDLGVNWKLKEHRLGFRGPKLTISEKFSLTKKKMEEAKKYAAQPAYPSTPIKPSFNPAAETHGMSHTVRTIPMDKPIHAPISTGGFPVSSNLVHVSTVTPTSAQYQLPTNEVRPPMLSSGLPSSHLGRDSSSSAPPRVERTQFRSDGGPNGSSHALQVQANSSANHPPALTWSAQTQSAKSGAEQKVPSHTSVRPEGKSGISMPQMTPVAARDQNVRPFVSQTASGNVPAVQQPLQPIHFVQPPLPNNHYEIAKIIQKILQPQPPDRPAWIPPSRDYMSKALTCQICQITFNEVDNVLVCDACERGYHIMCVQSSSNHRGIPRGEWHCMRCLSLSNGKPLPPKYGRVMRSNIQVKVPSNTAGVQMSSENKQGPSNTPGVQMSSENKQGASNTAGVHMSSENKQGASEVQMSSEDKHGALDPKDNQQKITANGSSVFQNPAHSGGGGSNHFQSTPDPKISNAKETQEDNTPSSGKDMDGKPLSGSCSSSERLSQPKDTSESSKSEDRTSESKLEPPPGFSNKDTAKSDHCQPSSNSQAVDGTGMPNCNHAHPSTNSQLVDGAGLPNCDQSPSSNSQVGEGAGLPKCDHSQPSSNSLAVDGAGLPNCLHSQPSSSSEVVDGAGLRKCDHSQTSSNSQVVDGAGLPKCDHSQPSSNSQVVDGAGLPSCADIPLEKCDDANFPLKDSDNSQAGGNLCSSLRYDIKRDDQGGAQANICETSAASGGDLDHSGFSSDGLKAVQWIGDPVEVGDEKLYYHTCSVDGTAYKLQDDALFQSSHGKLTPSKLQSMWEDRKTGSKWLIIHTCYFPGDLPENVDRPSPSESNEVYESNHDSTVMAGLIRGPCEVLSPAKFSEETERRSHLGREANNGLRPLFLCRWIYDEFKGLLQPVPE